jgi:hypothetical protein
MRPQVATESDSSTGTMSALQEHQLEQGTGNQRGRIDIQRAKKAKGETT